MSSSRSRAPLSVMASTDLDCVEYYDQPIDKEIQPVSSKKSSTNTLFDNISATDVIYIVVALCITILFLIIGTSMYAS